MILLLSLAPSNPSHAPPTPSKIDGLFFHYSYLYILYIDI